MKIFPEKLTQHLQSQMLPIYILSGDEPLLISEAQITLLEAAKQQGFDERQVLHAISTQDWHQLANDYQSLSLFSNKEIIDIRLTSSKFSDAAKQALAIMLEAINPDKLVIISCPKIESAATKAKWFKALEAQSGFLQFWPISKEQFPGWINTRLRQSGITLSKSGLMSLANLTEGNLLAAQQVIHRLNLLYGNAKVSDEQLMQVLSDHSQTDLYQLLDDILAADTNRIARALNNLRGQGTDPILILWLLSKEIRSYLTLLNAQASGVNLGPVYQSLQIWPKRQGAYRVIHNRHQPNSLFELLNLAYQIDLMVKGLEKQNPWDALLRLSLALAGVKI